LLAKNSSKEVITKNKIGKLFLDVKQIGQLFLDVNFNTFTIDAKIVVSTLDFNKGTKKFT
jgi:hypothetical protein